MMLRMLLVLVAVAGLSLNGCKKEEPTAPPTVEEVKTEAENVAEEAQPMVEEAAKEAEKVIEEAEPMAEEAANEAKEEAGKALEELQK